MPKGGSKKPGAPGVVIDRSGKRVRLRNIDHPLPWCVSTRNGEKRGQLIPNVWCEVPEEAYSMLKSKFQDAESFEVPDWSPGGEHDRPKSANRREHYRDEYVIEFPDEAPR